MAMRSLLRDFRTHAGLTEVTAAQRKVLALQQDAALALKNSVKDWGTVSYSYEDEYFRRTMKETKTLSAPMPSVVPNSKGGFNILVALMPTPYQVGSPQHAHVIRQRPAHREVAVSLDQLAEELTDYEVGIEDSQGNFKASADAFNLAARKNLDAAVKAVSKGLTNYKVTLVRKSETGNYWAKVFWAKLEASPS